MISLHQHETGKLCSKSMSFSRANCIHSFGFMQLGKVEIVFFFLTELYIHSFNFMSFIMQNINKQNGGLICLLLTTFYLLLIIWSSRELITWNSASTEISSPSNTYFIKILCSRVFDEESHNAFPFNFYIQTANLCVVITCCCPLP